MSGEGSEALPSGWCWAKLGELLTKIEAGSSFRCTERPPTDGEVGVAKVSAVTWGEYDEAESKTCFDLERIESKYMIRPRDFLFSRANTIELVGACVIVGEVQWRIMLSDKLLRFEFASVDPSFVLWLLRSPHGRKEIERLASGNQHGMRNIGQEKIRIIRVPLPPLPEQKRIVAKLDDLLARSRATREALTSVLPLLDRYRQSVLAAAFRGDITAEWRETRGTRSLHDWTTESLGGLAVANGTAIGPFGSNLKVEDYRDTGVPLVFVRNIRSEDFIDSRSRFVTPEKARSLAVHSVKAGDLLITKMGDPPGDTAVYPPDRPPGIITSDCIRLSPCPKTTSSFLRYWLRTDVMKNRMLEEVRGVAQQKMSLTRFRLVEVPLPPLPEQREIVRRVDAAFARIAAVRALVDTQLARLDALDRSILARAFRGELVPQDPADEPAAALLERLRAERAAAPAKKPPRRIRSVG